MKESKDIKLLFEGDDCALLIKECYLEDAGMYTLRAVNPLGVVVETATLTVERKSIGMYTFREVARLELSLKPRH